MTNGTDTNSNITEDDLPPGILYAGQEERDAFIAKFGRPPTEADPWFFDPSSTTPRHYSRESVRLGTAPICEWMAQLAEQAEYHSEVWKAMIYASRKTGLIFDQYSYLHATESQRMEYDKALQEYYDSSPSELRLYVQSLY